MKSFMPFGLILIFSLGSASAQSLTSYEFEKHLNQYQHDQAVSTTWLWVNVATLLGGVAISTVGSTLSGAGASAALSQGLTYGGYGLSGISVIGLITSLATLTRANKNYIETLRLQQNYHNLLNYDFSRDDD